MADASDRDLVIVILILIIVLIPVGFAAVRLGRTTRADGRFQTPVRCRDGHVFTTSWIPFVSFNAVRLGRSRFQYCPVGRHWTFVTPIPD
jgi:hypothetical protein